MKPLYVVARVLLLGAVGFVLMFGVGSAQAGLGRWGPATGPTSYVGSLAVDPRNDGIVYAGAEDGLFRSGDGARSWRRIRNRSTGIVRSLVIAPRDPQTVYAATGSAGVLKSTDGGASWRPVGLKKGVRALALDPRNPLTLYAGGYEDRGLYKSVDGARSWRRVYTVPADDAGHEVFATALALDPQHPQTVYACESDFWDGYGGGIFKTTNGGATWRALLPFGALALAIDPRNPQTVYASLYGGGGDGGIMKSLDGGKHWRFAGLDQRIVQAIAIDPRNPQTVYAGTESKGVFRSTDAGRHWQPFSQGLTNTNINALVVGASEPVVYAATEGGGVFDFRFR